MAPTECFLTSCSLLSASEPYLVHSTATAGLSIDLMLLQT